MTFFLICFGVFLLILIVVIALIMHEENQRSHTETQRHIEATRHQISSGNDETHGHVRDLKRWAFDQWKKRTHHGDSE